MAVQEGPDGVGEKAIRTSWPFEEGLIFGTTKRSGARSLTPEKQSLIPHRNKELL